MFIIMLFPLFYKRKIYLFCLKCKCRRDINIFYPLCHSPNDCNGWNCTGPKLRAWRFFWVSHVGAGFGSSSTAFQATSTELVRRWSTQDMNGCPYNILQGKDFSQWVMVPVPKYVFKWLKYKKDVIWKLEDIHILVSINEVYLNYACTHVPLAIYFESHQCWIPILEV